MYADVVWLALMMTKCTDDGAREASESEIDIFGDHELADTLNCIDDGYNQMSWKNSAGDDVNRGVGDGANENVTLYIHNQMYPMMMMMMLHGDEFGRPVKHFDVKHPDELVK